MTDQIAKTITVVDRSTKSLNKANADLIKTLEKAIEDVKGLSDEAELVASEIEFKASELAGLESIISDGRRTAQAQLQIEILEDRAVVLNSLMKDERLAYISKDDLNTLQTNYDNAIESNEDAVNAAVAKSASELNTKHSYGLRTLEAEHKTETAELNANAVALNSQINFLKVSLASAEKTIQAERDARIAIAASEAGAAGVVVNTSGK